MLDSWYRQAPSRNSTSARSMSENWGSSESARASVSSAAASFSSPSWSRAHASPVRARSSRSFAPAARACVSNLRELRCCGRVLVALAERRRARKLGLPAAPLASRDARAEEVGVYPELPGQPGDGLRRGPSLAALDLAQVFLAEAARLRARTARGRRRCGACAGECRGPRRRPPSPETLRPPRPRLLARVRAPCSPLREPTVTQIASRCYLTGLDMSVRVVLTSHAQPHLRGARHKNRATFGGVGRAAGSVFRESRSDSGELISEPPVAAAGGFAHLGVL